ETTPYGLTGAVFAEDRMAAVHASTRLLHTAGNFYINDKCTGAVVGQQPFGGSRASGTNDKPGSPSLLQRFVSPRSIKENMIPISGYTYPSNHPKTDRAALVDGQSLLLIDTKLLGVHQYHIGQTYQLIGVVVASSQEDHEELPKDLLEDVRYSLDIVLQARVVREVDGLDMAIYRKSVVLLRAFLQDEIKTAGANPV
ncbi:1-pyrroline-5-carboxylate dehydrogenase, partial [Coemansia sp. S142-1]